jgi:3-methyladenine DNA glycosylase AlkD
MLTHKHDLIHKALGWMIREVGKRCSIDELRGFLDQYAAKMPRTMLRYAIEKMDAEERKKYLAL